MVDLEKVKSGDQSEIGRLARTVSVWVYNIVISYLHNMEETEEVVQDTIMKTLNNVNQFKSESTLKTWVVRIAINEAKDLLKYKNRKKRTGKIISINTDQKHSGLTIEIPVYRDPENILESREHLEVLYRGINQLPANQRLAITLMKLEHHSMKEVAKIMEVTTKAVEGLVGRAKQNIIKYLDKTDIDFHKS